MPGDVPFVVKSVRLVSRVGSSLVVRLAASEPSHGARVKPPTLGVDSPLCVRCPLGVPRKCWRFVLLLLQRCEQVRKVAVTTDPLEAFLCLQQRVGKPATGLIGFGTKTCHATKLATCVEKRVLDRVGAELAAVKRVRNIQPVQREQIFAGFT